MLVSPDAISGNTGLAQLDHARRQGVAMSVVTNSVAPADEPLVSAAYQRCRVPMMKAGIELFELGPPQLDIDQHMPETLGASKDSPHSKPAFVDRRIVLLGSMSLELRESSGDGNADPTAAPNDVASAAVRS